MTFKEYLHQLTDCGEFKTIDGTVDPVLELAAICRREFKAEQGGSALLFNKVKNSSFSVAANLFGSKQRTATLLHSTSFEHFSKKLDNWLLQRSGAAADRFLNIEADHSSSGLATPFIEKACLVNLPAIKSWPKEGGNYLNLALALTQHPDTGERNLGLYRVQIVGENRLAINFSPQSGAGRHFEIAKRNGKALPLCLLIGVDPALIWVGAAPLPGGCDEFKFYQSLFEERLKWTEAATQPLKIPLETEMVIEGEILTDQTTVEGPYGNHTGHYVTRSDCPLVQVTAVRYQQQPIVPLTVVGPPPSENVYLGMANEILIRAMVKVDFPQVCDIWTPVETMFHGAAVVAVTPQSPADNKALIYELWKNSPLSRSRFILLVDENVHTRSISSSWWRMVNGLKNPRIYSDSGRTAIDVTELAGGILLEEDSQTVTLLQQRKDEYQLW